MLSNLKNRKLFVIFVSYGNLLCNLLYLLCFNSVFLSVKRFDVVLGCQRLADYLEGVKKNYDSAAQVLKHNCETNGYGESCYKLGAYHVTGKGNILQTIRFVSLHFSLNFTSCIPRRIIVLSTLQLKTLLNIKKSYKWLHPYFSGIWSVQVHMDINMLTQTEFRR